MSRISFSFIVIFVLLASCTAFTAAPAYADREVNVAGCNHVGVFCDLTFIHPQLQNAFLKNLSTAFAPKVTVWSSAEFNQEIRNLQNLNDALSEAVRREITAHSDEISNVIRVNDRGFRREIDLVHQTVEANQARIEESLNPAIKSLLRGNVCDHLFLPAFGSPMRQQRVLSLVTCLKENLDRWKGVNQQGRIVAAPIHSVLSFTQVLRVLEKTNDLLPDPDLDELSRQSLLNIQAEFEGFRNLNPAQE